MGVRISSCAPATPPPLGCVWACQSRRANNGGRNSTSLAGPSASYEIRLESPCRVSGTPTELACGSRGPSKCLDRTLIGQHVQPPGENSQDRQGSATLCDDIAELRRGDASEGGRAGETDRPPRPVAVLRSLGRCRAPCRAGRSSGAPLPSRGLGGSDRSR